MERSLTFAVTALLTAPVAFLLFAWLTTSMAGKGGSDVVIGYAYLSALVGMVAAVAWILLIYYVANRFISASLLKYVQLADIALLAGWLLVWWIHLDRQPQKFTYAQSRPILEVELRASASVLLGKSIEDACYIQFTGGENFNLSHPERVRKEEDSVILPWETTLFTVKEWEVRVFLHDQLVTFMLNLPKQPAHTMIWSEWSNPTSTEDELLPQSLMLRYRFRIVPYGSQ